MENNRYVVLFDTRESFENILPISYTRPVSGVRVGILTIKEKWQRLMPAHYSALTALYLREKFPICLNPDGATLFVAGNVLPSEDLAGKVCALAEGEALVKENAVIAFCGNLDDFTLLMGEDFNYTVGNPDNSLSDESSSVIMKKEFAGDVKRINYVFDIFRQNGEQIKSDYRMIVKGESPVAPDRSVTIIGDMLTPDGLPSLYIEEGATVEGAILNVKEGPIYIGKDAKIMEGSCVRGPLALCDHAQIRMGSKVYGSNTIGPYCKVGGELDNVVMIGYSNKAHDGYLGNAVIGEWCNLGAGAVASNLKNDYSKIRIWNYYKQSFMRTDLLFCGLVFGDHSKAGINTMFNTATVVGVGVNLHGSGFPRQFIPSFSTGSPEGGFENVQIDKFMDTAGKVMARRGLELTETDRHIFEAIYRSASRFK